MLCSVFVSSGEGVCMFTVKCQNVPYGLENQNQAKVTATKDYLLSAFPENLK